MKKNKITEDLKRFNNLLGYNPKMGIISEKITPNRSAYFNEGELLNEDDPEEGEETPQETPEEEPTEVNTDFDFGDEGSPEEETTDEFGTADEFSAADDLESLEQDVEEIDVTFIVKGTEDAKEMSKQAVNIGQENMSYLKSLTDKLSNLENKLSKMDMIANKIGKLEQDIKTPEEKLELRSLDSFPFNLKLSDYWEDKAKNDDRYKISKGDDISEPKEYILDPKNMEFNKEDVKKSFNI